MEETFVVNLVKDIIVPEEGMVIIGKGYIEMLLEVGYDVVKGQSGRQ